MPLHLLKLCVGAGSIAELEREMAARAERVHTTRMVPKRLEELLADGSLYWVIKGQIAARQILLDICPFTDETGISRCRLVLAPEVTAVLPRPCRPFQGWRYLADDERPPDLGAKVADMPEHLRFALRELCLL